MAERLQVVSERHRNLKQKFCKTTFTWQLAKYSTSTLMPMTSIPSGSILSYILTLGSVGTTYIGERITDLKLGNGTFLLIFTSIISYLPVSFGRTVAQAFRDVMDIEFLLQ